MKNGYRANAGVGASSIMLLIVVVCLTLFSVLTFVTARNDAALTTRFTQSINAYYDADARAQNRLAALDEALRSGAEIAKLSDVSISADGIGSFSIRSTDEHALTVTFLFDKGYCEILSYRYESVGAWNASDDGGLWQGG